MKKIKMPDSFTILFLIVIVVAVLSWIVPSGEYVNTCTNGQDIIMTEDMEVCPNNEEAAREISYSLASGSTLDSSLYNEDYSYNYQVVEQETQGLWQVLNAPVNGFYDAIDIALFVLIIGGFINVVMKTGALDSAIGALLKKFDGNEIKLIPILMIIFGIGGTTYGMAEETIGFYLLIVPVFLAAGFDSLVGVRVILLGAGAGVLASTVNPFAIGAAVASSGLDIGIGDGIVSRLVLFIIIEAIAIITTMRYAEKVKADKQNSAVSDLHEQTYNELVSLNNSELKLTKAHKLVLSIFAITFALMVISVIPWEDFGINIFVNIADYVNSNIPLIAGTTGIVPLGWWWFGELTMLFLVGAIIVGIVSAKYNLYDGTFIDAFLEGCKDLLGVALIIALSRGITVVMSSAGMDATLLNSGSQILSELSATAFTIGSFIFYIPLSFLIPSTSGLAAASMPVMAPLADIIGGNTAAVYTITAYSAASGLVNLITPTSGVVMGGLALAKVPYDRWLKHVGPTVIYMFIASLLFLSIGVAIGFVI